MTTDQQKTTPAVAFGPLLAAFTSAIFLRAALLFSVQPMFAKMVLPRLGGSPPVWSVAMVFFQAALLAGYAYAHLLTRSCCRAACRSSSMSLVIVATFALPLAIAGGWGRPPDRRRDVLAARAVRGLDRAAVLRAVRQRSAAAGVVRAHRPSGRRRPVFPLRGEQRRQLPRADLLSVRDRAVHPARRPDAHVVGRLLRADRADRRLRRAAHARVRARPDAPRAAPSGRRAAERARRRPGATPRHGSRSPPFRPAC